MTSKQGRTPRRNMPAPRLPEKREFIPPNVTCPHCGMRFNLRRLEGSYLRRWCPQCKVRISEESFDKLAQEAHERRRAAGSERGELEKKISSLEVKASALNKWWQWPKKRLLERRMARMIGESDPSMKTLSEEMALIDAKLNEYARDRYFLGEWFLRTHTFCRVPKKPGIIAYALAPRYADGEDGFLLAYQGGGNKANSIVAEFAVFEALRKRVVDSDSPLHGAQLMPNLYFLKDGNWKSRSFWCQVDLVVATEGCAFVIEVKNWRTDIVVEEPFRELLISDDSPIFTDGVRTANGLRHYNVPLCQNSDHARYFLEACGKYSFDQIYEVTVFVNPRSFKCEERGFVNNVLVGELSDGGGTFIEAMEITCRENEPSMSEDELAAMGESMVDRYGDLDLSKGAVHERRF